MMITGSSRPAGRPGAAGAIGLSYGRRGGRGSRRLAAPQVTTRGGFALIEMMLTMMVLSVGLLAMASYGATMTRQMRDGGGMVVAGTVARARFERVSAMPCQTLAAGTESAASGTVSETWTITPGSRSVAVTNQVSFPVARSRRTYTFQMLIPCAARP
jgi:prepilin-type N-terminal cleavage/methylation domain-containing protein